MHDGQSVGAVPWIPIPENVVLDHHGRVAPAPVTPPVVSPGRPADIAASPIEIDEGRLPAIESSRHPGPPGPGPVIDPAPVMVGQPTPGLVADPGPTAGKIAPPSVPKRRPSHCDGGHPDVPVGSIVGPVAMTVQRMDSRVVHTAQVTGGTAADQKGVPAPAPELEVVQVAHQRLDSDLASVQQQLLSGLQSFFPVPAVDFGPALVDHQAHPAAGIGLDPVESFLADPHCGQFHLHVDRTGIIHPEDQVTLLNLQEGLLPGQLREEDVGFSGDPGEITVPQFHLDPRIGVGDDPVAADQGKVERHFAPVHVAGRLVGGAAVMKLTRAGWSRPAETHVVKIPPSG